MKCLRAIPLATLIVLFCACPQDPYLVVAKSLNIIADTLQTTQKTVFAAEANGMIERNDARAIVDVLMRLNEAGRQAKKVTEAIYKLDPESKKQVSTLLQPFVASLEECLDKNLLGIKNEKTKAEVRAGLETLLTTLRTISSVTEAK